MSTKIITPKTTNKMSDKSQPVVALQTNADQVVDKKLNKKSNKKIVNDVNVVDHVTAPTDNQVATPTDNQVAAPTDNQVVETAVSVPVEKKSRAAKTTKVTQAKVDTSAPVLEVAAPVLEVAASVLEVATPVLEVVKKSKSKSKSESKVSSADEPLVDAAEPVVKKSKFKKIAKIKMSKVVTTKKAKSDPVVLQNVDGIEVEIHADDDDDIDDKVGFRYFKLIYNNKIQGRYRGKKPKQAANKAFSSIVKAFKKNNVEQIGEVNFSIRECTRKSKHKEYIYKANRILLSEPVVVEIKNKDGSVKPITYKSQNKLQKATREVNEINVNHSALEL